MSAAGGRKKSKAAPTSSATAFDYHYRDVHRCKIKITELVPGKKVAWRVLDNYFSFTKDTTEWTGTDIVFDIAEQGRQDRSPLHALAAWFPNMSATTPAHEGWSTYINGSLRDLIATGKGQPNVGRAHDRYMSGNSSSELIPGGVAVR